MKLSTGQLIALNHSLSDFNEEATFKSLMHDIRSGDHELTGVWEPLEDMSNDQLAEHIESLSESIDEALSEVQS